MSLKGFYKTDVVTVSPDQLITEAADIMRQRNVGDVIVVDDSGGKRMPIGLLTDRDIVVGCVADGSEKLAKCKVSDVMTEKPVCAFENEGVYEVVQKMRKNGVGRMPIVDDQQQLIGIITSKNILALLSDELTELVEISDAQKEAGKARLSSAAMAKKMSEQQPSQIQ